MLHGMSYCLKGQLPAVWSRATPWVYPEEFVGFHKSHESECLVALEHVPHSYW